MEEVRTFHGGIEGDFNLHNINPGRLLPFGDRLKIGVGKSELYRRYRVTHRQCYPDHSAPTRDIGNKRPCPIQALQEGEEEGRDYF
jgi:hypothetical protein|tara:strand:+ start:1942 stop:2199 length:258 start_codon:yes stop_codon:yes gene_type:complete